MPPSPEPPPPPGPIPYPVPTPIVIRVITDPVSPPAPPPGLPLPPLPSSPIIEENRPLQFLPPPGLKFRRSGKSDDFYGPWDKFTLKKKGAVPSLDVDVEGRPGHKVKENTEGVESRQNATTSYAEARESCKAKVEAIVRECKRLNQKYYDRMFNLPDWDTLVSLAAEEEPISIRELQGVGAVKRISDIFEEPHFYIDGATASDVKQGIIGDCWFLAAITALSGNKELIERLCVARDEEVGVYGFVFFRDGEWISEVVDDRLCLRYSDEQQSYPTDFLVVVRGDKNALSSPLHEMSYAVQRLPKEFRESLRKGSNALYFASCHESDETWLPLIEKAYAKAHGDYQAIDGGVTGEGIEDLTGGVATYIFSENVLDKDKLWTELMQVNKKFLFGCGSRRGRDSDPADDEGFVRGHAYTVLAAKEVTAPEDGEKKKRRKKGWKKPVLDKNGKVRLLKLRNPWGNQEWNGAWSDGSEEWTPQIMQELDHTFGDDGIFWISYEDFLRFYPVIDRIRLIGPEWEVTQQWAALNVPWTVDYLDTVFEVTISKPGPVVLVLSQPDSRYFKGLLGRYRYNLHFRLYKEGDDTYLLRSMDQSGSMRSCNAELEMEPGVYRLLVKITAERLDDKKTPEQMIREYRDVRREKLMAVGKSFDLTHSKGKLREMEKSNMGAQRTDARKKMRGRAVKDRDLARKQRLRERARNNRIKDELERKRGEKKEKMREEKKKRKADQEAEEKKEAEAEKEKEKEGGDVKAGKEETKEEQKDPEEAEKKDDEKDQKKDDEKKVDASDAGTQIKQEAATEKALESKHGVELSKSEQTDIAKPQPQDAPEVTVEGAVTDALKTGSSTTTGQPTPDSTPEFSAGDKEKEPETKLEESTKPSESQPEKLQDFKEPGDKDVSSSSPEVRTVSEAPPESPRHVHRVPHPIPEPGTIIIERVDAPEDCQSTSTGQISMCSSVIDDDFAWDDTMDGPGISDGPESEAASDDESSGDEMYADDPWQATCVIGLRVCSLNEGAQIEVVRGHGVDAKGMGRERSPG